LIPFIVAMLIFPLREAQSPFFETIMPLTLTICTVVFSILYFKGVEHGYLAESVKLGILWFGISLVIDLFMFMWGPMKMPFMDYMMDIGFTYLMFPMITIGFGYLLERKA
jgi:hypothetical protein